MTDNFPNLERGEAMQVQETKRILIKMNPKRPTPRHIIINMLDFKDKERIIKVARKDQIVTYKRSSDRLAADFSRETLQAIREWQ